MSEWKKYKLGDVSSISSSKRIFAKEYQTEGIPFYRGKEIIEKYNGNAVTTELYITKQRYNEIKEKFDVPRKGDILLTSVGTLGIPWYVDEDAFYFKDGNLTWFRANEKCDSEFLYLWLNSVEAKHQIDVMCIGSTQKALTIDTLKKFEITLPDVKTQRKIVNIINPIVKKIKQNSLINDNLEQQAIALFKSWFIDFEPFNGQVPKTWVNGVLGDFVEIKRGGSPRPIQNFLSDSGFHWLKISDATGISSPFINEIKEYIIEDGLKKTVYLKSGSLVLSNSATPGLPKILDIDTCIHDGWLYFPSSQFSNVYLYLYFKHIRDNLIAIGNGSVFTNLKTDILKNYPTNLPTEDVLKEFDGLVQPIFSMILLKTRETKRLSETRDVLLQKLMSGELDVSNIEF